jgi:hypothetical protein
MKCGKEMGDSMEKVFRSEKSERATGRIGDVDNEEAADVFDLFRNSGLFQEEK